MRMIASALLLVFSSLLTFSQTMLTPSLPLDDGARRWVDNTLDEMTLEQKVGQLVVPGTDTNFTNLTSEKFQQVRENILRYHVGGYHAFKGDVLPAAFLISRMQEMAQIPLLITADLEGGAGLIFPGATRFPKAMALGATFDSTVPYQVGQITASEAKRIGVGVNFYPVVDVNINPNNPIINIRSFGEDPEQVSRMATAYIRGIQENGLLATAKHFPGHGDTEVDSHLEMPVVTASLKRMNAVELLPFRTAIRNGVSSIMTAHLHVPVLDPEEGLPATLSRRILTDLLRHDMGFQGLIFTDAMNMGGIDSHDDGEAAIRAIQAGANIILYPSNVKTTFESLLGAIQKGEISQERLDQSVRLILESKARLNLHTNRGTDIVNLDRHVGSEQNKQLAQEFMDRAVTLVRDAKQVLPFSPKAGSTILLLTLIDQQRRIEERGDEFVREFEKRHAVIHVKVLPDASRRELLLIRQFAQRADYLVVGAYIRVAAYRGTLNLSANQMELLENLSGIDLPLAFVLFGSPYLLPSIPTLPSYIVTYEDYPGAERAATKAILGEIPFRGKLPVTIPGLYPIGHGIHR